MLAVQELPKIDELNELVDNVPAYPVSAGDLAQLALAQGASRSVIDFYRSFPSDQVFSDRDDLTGRSEQVVMMNIEEEEQPFEQLRSPQE